MLFINADREYREGKAQNHLRPEDIDKIIHAYRSGEDIPAYARKVPKTEIAAEEYNCNIRRYVDNAPAPEPHDVRAHLHGGVPIVEVDSLEHFWSNYPQLREDCFVLRDKTYLDIAPVISEKHDISDFVSTHQGVTIRHAELMEQLENWWQTNLPIVEALAPDPENQNEHSGNVYQMRSNLLTGAPCYLTKFRDSCRLNSFTYAANGRCPERPASVTTTHKSRFVITPSNGWTAIRNAILASLARYRALRLSELPCRLSGTKNHHFASAPFP